MMSAGCALRRMFSALAVTGLLLTGMPQPSEALQCSGLTIFGGPGRDNELKYCLDNGRENRRDTYWLKIPKDKVDVAILELKIEYPENYRGEFDEEQIEVKVNDETIAVQEVFWDRENRFISIYPVEPIAADNEIEIVLDDVENPRRGGMFYFNCKVVTRGGPPLPLYLGTWVLNID
ncbi:DUF2808 domain-containing protein [Phormidium sp. CCY1219]|uniref:DUF2808 domain-containing protein n=1 Tax=Phormidium sp. CCY1219 TaxID=2886104 RepID=UPI002D1F2990|nr:DUF2808 domain-containing protein [Phormidium sp. CCY1219]MEB3827594.1 DUF2808 domain-containing protein [Phormidium sp. CCY1219]